MTTSSSWRTRSTSRGREPRSRSRRLTMHAATAILSLSTTVMLTAGLHYENEANAAPHLTGGSKIPAAAIAWGAITTVLIPVLQATTKWPNKKATLAAGSTGIAIAAGTALTALAATMEAGHAANSVMLGLRHQMSNYGTDPAISREIDDIQRDYACCGAQGPGIYESARDHITGEVPSSCCANKGQPCDTLDTDQLNQGGCADPLGRELARSLEILTAILAAHALTTGLAATGAMLVNAGQYNRGEHPRG